MKSNKSNQISAFGFTLYSWIFQLEVAKIFGDEKKKEWKNSKKIIIQPNFRYNCDKFRFVDEWNWNAFGENWPYLFDWITYFVWHCAFGIARNSIVFSLIRSRSS